MKQGKKKQGQCTFCSHALVHIARVLPPPPVQPPPHGGAEGFTFSRLAMLWAVHFHWRFSRHKRIIFLHEVNPHFWAIWNSLSSQNFPILAIAKMANGTADKGPRILAINSPCIHNDISVLTENRRSATGELVHQLWIKHQSFCRVRQLCVIWNNTVN